MGFLFPHLPNAGQSGRHLFSYIGAAAAHVALLALLVVAVPTEELAKTLEPMAVRLIEIQPELPKPLPRKPPEAPKPKKILLATPEKIPPRPPRNLLTSNAASDTSPSFIVPPPAPSTVQSASITAAPEPVAITAARFDADYLDNPKPRYPNASRRLGEQGTVLLRVHVGTTGLAEKVEIKLSSGFARLDQAASDAISRWRFIPARRGELAVAAWVQVPITFQLES